MNNIELGQLKRDMKTYLNYSDEQLECIAVLSERKINAIKRDIEKIRNKTSNATRDRHSRNMIGKRINDIFKYDEKFLKEDKRKKEEKQRLLKEQERIRKQKEEEQRKKDDGKRELDKRIKEELKKIEPKKPKPLKIEKPKTLKIEEPKEQVKDKKRIPNKPKQEQTIAKNIKRIDINVNIKPKILFICDVKGWAWWIKSHYIKKYLDEYYNIEIICVLGPDSTPVGKINQKGYDVFFSFGFSYIDFLYKVPKHKKIVGVTAHRRRNVILPKMRNTAWHHANSIMLLKEMHEMGFKDSTFYVPNGVDIELFKPLNPIRTNRDLIVGHVGKSCHAKGQNECIFPAMKESGVQSYTNTRNWKDKIPFDKMVHEYNKMDLFLCSSKEDGTPNPAIEAAACGRPIISNRIGNMPELIRDNYNGFLIPRKKQAYVEKINWFKNHRNELIRMGNNARKEIEENWSWELMSRNYLIMFDAIFDKKRDESKYDNPALKHLEKL